MSVRTPEAREEIVQGAVESVVYQTRDGAFSVVRFVRESNAEELVIVGDLGSVSPGETLRVRGRFAEHPVHGRRFQVQSFTPVLPSSKDGMARYLGSGLIPGVGKQLAERLVSEFGDRALDVITTQSAKLRKVPGIGKQRALAIASAVRERRDETELMSYLHGLGLGPSLARRIRKRYGERAVHVIRDDPYLVAEQVEGVGFRTADSIGRASGLALDDPRRAAGAVLHLLAQAADHGHAYATRDQLVNEAEALDVPPGRVEEAIESLAGRELVVREDEAVYASPLHRAEVQVAKLLRARCQDRMPARVVPDESALSSLSGEQAEAVRATFVGRLLVITGGPGTGKTTTVRGIVEAHRSAGHTVVLCAPTGRAAKRLSEAAGSEAKTIHRLLEWNPATARFQRDRAAPIEGDLVLVDEASMLNLQLAERLFAAVPAHVPLVLVGDVDQLPPVGPGQVLRSLIDSGIAPVVRLHTVFRQAQESHIVAGAHSILRGEVPLPTPSGTRGVGDLFVVKTREPEVALERLREMLERMPTAYGLDPKRDVMVLSPMRRGPLGTERLNEYLQATLNPSDRPGPQPLAPRPGDRVMQLRNDYEKEAFNGDLGEVQNVEGGITYVMMDGREVRYRRDELDDLALAYASTVHKVQGSEFPAVVVVLHASNHVLLSRALLYTAVTRAKRLVVILGDERALSRAVHDARSNESQSKLEERLRLRPSS
ncbi:MAG: ATP-dependent RecD-like helicase [Myxococcaceae bacterium]|nr:ATP-dependent RecD-like helicase [Myxococcaceae bacterium]